MDGNGNYSDIIQVTRNKEELTIFAIENIKKGDKNFTRKVKTIAIPLKK